MFPFDRLLPELKGEILRLAPLSIAVCMGLTCRELFNHPNRPTVGFRTFVRAVCEEGAHTLLPFIDSVELIDCESPHVGAEDLEVAAKYNHLELLLSVLSRDSDPDLFCLAIRAAAQYEHEELLQALRERLQESSISFEDSVNEGILLSGNLDNVRRLPCNLVLKQRALELASLPVVQLLLKPEDFQSEKAGELAVFAVASTDPRVLPWCVSHGLSIERRRQVLLLKSGRLDRLENFLFLVRGHDAELLQRGLEEALSYLAQRVLRHYFDPSKTPPFPRDAFSGHVRDLLVSYRAAEYRHITLFDSLGLLEGVDIQSLPPVPDLGYLKFLVQKGWDPTGEDVLADLAAHSWAPQSERCILWLVEHGAKLTDGLFSRALSAFRVSFLRKLLALGCPTESGAYIELRGCALAELDERYWLMRSAGVAVLPIEDICLAGGQFLSLASIEVIRDLVEQQGSVPSSTLRSLYGPILDVPLMNILLPLLLPKLAEHEDVPFLYLYALLRPWRAADGGGAALDVQVLLEYLDWLGANGYPVPKPDPATAFNWSAILRYACRGWGFSPSAAQVLSPLLGWFGRHCPMEDPRGVFEAFRAEDDSCSLDRANAMIFCDFLRSQGATITDQEIAETWEE